MSNLEIVCLGWVVLFFGLLMAPFAGLMAGDIILHAELLFRGAGYTAPVMFIAAIYEGCRS